MPSAIVIAQSIAKVLAPTCFQKEDFVFEHIFEHIFEHVLDQHDLKMCWNLKKHSKTHSKTGASFKKHVTGLNAFI